ncbi:hypothetical protein Syun_020569 [Stephania yunnanensis]|uniref:Uncharacterized protein n=1 Tax=Stephania yunnanensis TaxID=152371 RepID=A0AAP0IEG5_9MAGN
MVDADPSINRPDKEKINDYLWNNEKPILLDPSLCKPFFTLSSPTNLRRRRTILATTVAVVVHFSSSTSTATRRLSSSSATHADDTAGRAQPLRARLSSGSATAARSSPLAPLFTCRDRPLFGCRGFRPFLPLPHIFVAAGHHHDSAAPFSAAAARPDSSLTEFRVSSATTPRLAHRHGHRPSFTPVDKHEGIAESWIASRPGGGPSNHSLGSLSNRTISLDHVYEGLLAWSSSSGLGVYQTIGNAEKSLPTKEAKDEVNQSSSSATLLTYNINSLVERCEELARIL